MYILVRIWEWLHLTEPWLYWLKHVRFFFPHIKWIKEEGPPRLVWELHNAIKDPGSFYFLLCHLQNVAFFIVFTGGYSSSNFAAVFQEGRRGRIYLLNLPSYDENSISKTPPSMFVYTSIGKNDTIWPFSAAREPGNRNDFNWAYCCSNKIRVLSVRKKERLAVG